VLVIVCNVIDDGVLSQHLRRQHQNHGHLQSTSQSVGLIRIELTWNNNANNNNSNNNNSNNNKNDCDVSNLEQHFL